MEVIRHSCAGRKGVGEEVELLRQMEEVRNKLHGLVEEEYTDLLDNKYQELSVEFDRLMNRYLSITNR